MHITLIILVIAVTFCSKLQVAPKAARYVESGTYIRHDVFELDMLGFQD